MQPPLRRSAARRRAPRCALCERGSHRHDQTPTISTYHATMNTVGPARLSARLNATTADGEYGNIPSG